MWLATVSMILLTMALVMLAIGLTGTIGDQGISFRKSLLIVTTGMATSVLIIMLIAHTRRMGERTVGSLSGFIRTKLTVHSPYELTNAILGTCTFVAAVSIALVPVVANVALYFRNWSDANFIWYSLTHFILDVSLVALVSIVPVTALGFAAQTTRGMFLSSQDGNSPIPVALLVGAFLGVAATQLIKNAVGTPTAILMAATLPCLAIPLLILRAHSSGFRTQNT